MLPTYIIIEIAKYLPLQKEMKIFYMSKSLYEKSNDIRKKYNKWWKQYKNKQYKFDNIKFVQYLIYCKFDLGDEIRSVCKGGNIECVQLIISAGATNWNRGLYGACDGGHIHCTQLMINMGATNWNSGLYYACISGNMDCVHLMINMGADDWNSGLYYACMGDSKECVQLMIDKGADDWNRGLTGACRNGSIDFTQLMIKMGATECYCEKSPHKH